MSTTATKYPLGRPPGVQIILRVRHQQSQRAPTPLRPISRRHRQAKSRLPQADLDFRIAEYNEQRPHQGRWCFGKAPMQTFLDALPLAKEKLMAA